MMAREDILRELELLPLWYLRTPLAESVLKVETSAEIQPDKMALEKSAYEKPLSSSELAVENIKLSHAADTQHSIYQCVASDDDTYLFVLASSAISADAALLQRNMWRAMRLNTKAAVSLNREALEDAQCQVMITMGEIVAQQLLASTKPLSELRGNVHQYKNKQLVATFDATYLLENPQYKRQAWADLCLSMQTLLDLKRDKS